MSVSICKHEKFYTVVIDGTGTHHDTLNDYEYNLKRLEDKKVQP